MRFFPKGLNPCKIQTIFKLVLLLKFVIHNPERFGGWAKQKIVLFKIICNHAKFGYFWIPRKWCFAISNTELVN
jgi:hypothetical protein